MGGVRVRSQSAPDRKRWVPHLGVQYSWYMGGVRVRSQSAPDRKGWVPHLGVLLVHGWGEGEE